MNNTEFKTKEEVFAAAQKILKKNLRSIIPKNEIGSVEAEVSRYGSKMKGLLGIYIQRYVFGKEPDNKNEADFYLAGVELKTNPLKKHPTRKYTSKERLVFSMIDYDEVIKEVWRSSSFLEKNKFLLLMFYLHMQGQSIVDHEFKFIKQLDLLNVNDISADDILQIQRDWEFIVAKIKAGEAHLLSEGDTYYLGACTKAQNSRILRDQPTSRIPAKPRAFSFKQQYLNYLIQRDLLGNKTEADSLLEKARAKKVKAKTIEAVVHEEFAPFIGKTDKEIAAVLGWKSVGESKNYKRILVNRIFGVESNKIEELEKANVTLKVLTLEHTGTLRESISFPAFDYKDLVTQVWQDDDTEEMADLHALLETQKFLFVVFQKVKDSDDIILRKTMFWNFPMKDLSEAERVWQKTIDAINEGRYEDLPKMKDSSIVHVRPNGKDSSDTVETPQGTKEMKKCFWLNAKYIEKAIEN